MLNDAFAIIIGVVCGVLASIPVSLLILGMMPNRVVLMATGKEPTEGKSA